MSEATTKTVAAAGAEAAGAPPPPSLVGNEAGGAGAGGTNGGGGGGSRRLELMRPDDGGSTVAAPSSSAAAPAHEKKAAAAAVAGNGGPEEQPNRPRPPSGGGRGADDSGAGAAASGGDSDRRHPQHSHTPAASWQQLQQQLQGGGEVGGEQQGVSGSGSGLGPFMLPTRQRSFWEGQGSVEVPPEEEGGGDSSDTLGAESDTEEREREEEMAAVLAAAVAEGGVTSPSPSPPASSSGGGGFPLVDPEPSAAAPSVLPACACGGPGPVAGAAVGAVAAAVGSAAAGSGGLGAGGAAAGSVPPAVVIPGVAPAGGAAGGAGGLVVGTPLGGGGGGGLGVSLGLGLGLGSLGLHARVTSIPSILPHPEALLAIRERSHQLYVPLPVAVSRTFGERNNSMIDRRAWLEVEDKKHRYAKNLRLYYKEWDRRGQPGASFWAWLDAGDGTDAEGNGGLVELEECPRSQLETETVHYCSSPEERRAYEIRFLEGGLLHRRKEGGDGDGDGEEWARVTTGPDGWIFVLRDGIIYAHEKKTDQVPRFHHSSFFAGECVQAAGLFVAAGGALERLYPHSGHYRPTDSHLLSLLLFLESRGVDLEPVQVDVQLVMKVARAHDANRGGRRRKIDSPYMWTGAHAKHFLLAKRQAWAGKLFAQLIMHPLTLAKDS